MRTDNIFLTGSQVSGESLIGYKKEMKYLRDLLINIRTSNGISLIGLHRMGKTSLIKAICKEAEDNSDNLTIPVYYSIDGIKSFSEKCSAFSELLLCIISELRYKLEERGLLKEGDILSQRIDKFENTSPETMSFRNAFKDIFRRLKAMGLKLILVLDEFDCAENIFKDTADYELFRTLSSGVEYCISLVLVSRRQLYMIEKKNYNNSTFHGVMKTRILQGFCEEDRNEYYEVLHKEYEIDLTPENREELEYYAGCSPYIYSVFGHDLVYRQQSGRDQVNVAEVYRTNASDIINYYATIYSLLENDKHIEKLCGIIIGPKLDITKQDTDLLESLGYLSQRSSTYESLSGYFKAYIISKAVSAGSWDSIIAVEKKCKLMVDAQIKKEFGVDQLTYQDWKGIMDNCYHGNFNDTIYSKFIYSNQRDFGINSTMLDVMSLSDVVKIIRLYWSNCFAKYFNNDLYDKWATQFKECAMARNPLAHGHEEYLSDTHRTIINGYCQLILSKIG